MLFDIGALLLVASVPMGIADGHNLGLLSPTAFAAYVLVLGAFGYGLSSIVKLWRHRRDNAFNAFYVREHASFYKHEAAIRALYFALNPMPFLSIFHREWTHTIRRPTAEQMLKANSAADPMQTVATEQRSR